MSSLPLEARRTALVRLAALGGARAAAAGLGFLATLQLAPAVGPETLGTWAMLLAVQGWALHLSECGLRSVVTAEGARTAGGPRRLLPVYLGTRLALASAVTLATLVGTAALAPGLVGTMGLVLASLLLIALQLDWLALVDDRPLAAGVLLLVRPAAWCALLFLAGKPIGLERLAAFFALAWALAALASWPLLASRAPGRAEGDPPLPPGRMLRLGFPLMLVTLGNQAVLAADILLVGLVLGAGRAGAFYLASALIVAGLVLANAMNQIAIARMGRLREEPSLLRAELGRQLRTAVGAGLGIALAGAAIGPFAIPVLFGPSFEEAVPVFASLLPWLVLQHPSAVLQGAVVAARGQRALLCANGSLLLAAAPVLLAGLVTGSLELCALSRSAGELGRVMMLGCTVGRRVAAAQHEAIAGRPRIATLVAAPGSDHSRGRDAERA